MKFLDMEYTGILVKICEGCGVPLVYDYVKKDPALHKKIIKKLCWNCEPAKPEGTNGEL